MKQAHAQKEHVNLEPLFAAYKTYNEKCNLWKQSKISNEAFDEAWLTLGKHQREVLPRHMLKEFCRKGNSWNAESKFDVNIDPRPVGADIYNYNTGRNESILPLPRNLGIGFNFSLVRGARSQRACAQTARGQGAHAARALARHDWATFDHLFKVRTKDLSRLQRLTANSTNAQKMKK